MFKALIEVVNVEDNLVFEIDELIFVSCWKYNFLPFSLQLLYFLFLEAFN
jgi:hypothetical protein